MMPLFKERSTDLIKEKLSDLFEGLDRISSDQDFGKMHRDFCKWFVKKIRFVEAEEPLSYGHAARFLILLSKSTFTIARFKAQQKRSP